jgi:hypothetical protein
MHPLIHTKKMNMGPRIHQTKQTNYTTPTYPHSKQFTATAFKTFKQ